MSSRSCAYEVSLIQSVDEEMLRCAILENGYFTALREGSMSLAIFRETQRQFYFAVRFFSRPMAALMARMPDSALRQGLIHNLAEEHGFVDEAEDGAPLQSRFDPALAHDLTIKAFLRTLGPSGGEPTAIKEGVPVRAFNLGLMGACMMERTEFAFACLGVIEYAFADISALIGKKVVENSWVTLDELVHYKLHAEIDKGHAADFFTLVESAWTTGGESREAVEDGIRFGLHLFNQFYENLYREATTSP
ncbi:hypothetical protein BH11VER1_BH11VER1_27000 [soil metagenome]